jgi:oligoendopeptidase F
MTEHAVGRWSLDDLIPAQAGPEMDRAFENLEVAVSEIESRRGTLAPSMPQQAFGELLKWVERSAYLANQLRGYSVLWLSEQTSDQNALAFRQRVNSALADGQNRTLFFDHWWKKLDDANANRLLATSGDVRYYLETVRRFAPFTLSEPVEQAINLKNINGVEGITTIYEMIANGFMYQITVDGETKSLTRSELMVYARSDDPVRRKAAYDALLGVFSEKKDVLAQLYKYVAGDWGEENVALRGMASPISVRNLNNDIPDDVVETLLATCRANVGLFQRFFQLKAQWLGMDRLRRVDLYAPLRPVERRYPYDEGVRLVQESLQGFSPRLAEMALRVIEEGHVDSQPRRGKDTGAFCYGVLPDKTPWVLVNYNDRDDSVATLGHELGHAIHSMIAEEHSALTFHSSLPLAETASNFVEILLLYRMFETDPDPAFRRYLLGKFVDDSYASILRQAYFVLFEIEAHRLIREENATPDRLAECYFDLLREQFGDSIELTDAFRWEWISIPHIYATPFYCYAYTFGLLLVLALYQQYLKEGEDFVPRYHRILEYGGSLAPMAILDEAGFDVRSAEFWQGGFDVIAGMIDELESFES